MVMPPEVCCMHSCMGMIWHVSIVEEKQVSRSNTKRDVGLRWMLVPTKHVTRHGLVPAMHHLRRLHRHQDGAPLAEVSVQFLELESYTLDRCTCHCHHLCCPWCQDFQSNCSGVREPRQKRRSSVISAALEPVTEVGHRIRMLEERLPNFLFVCFHTILHW